MFDLPKVFVNKINNDINNNQQVSNVRDNTQINIDDILSNDKYVFNHKYIITLNNNKEITDSIISKENNKVLTLNNKWIDINDIKSVTEIKK